MLLGFNVTQNCTFDRQETSGHYLKVKNQGFSDIQDFPEAGLQRRISSSNTETFDDFPRKNTVLFR
jgi:hypothetical protein